MKICTLSFQVNCISQVFLKAFHSISVFIFMIVLNCVFNKAIAQTPYQPFFNDSTLLYKAQNLDFTGWNDQYQKSYYKAASFDSVLNNIGDFGNISLDSNNVAVKLKNVANIAISDKEATSFAYSGMNKIVLLGILLILLLWHFKSMLKLVFL